jgi:tetratricopeptide (TPR) repeat protein
MGRCFLLVLLLTVWHAVAAADQREPELDGLFAKLAAAADPATAYDVEQRIWTLWFKASAPRATELLDQARTAASSGALPEALRLFEHLTADFPDYAEGWNQRAIMHYLMGDIPASLAAIEKTLALEPRHFGALAGRGQCYVRLERARDALAAFEAALAINPWMPIVQEQVDMLRAYLRQQMTPI